MHTRIAGGCLYHASVALGKPINKSLSKYNANVSAKAKELIDYYFNLANVDFDYAENQYEKDMELSKIYEEAMKD